MTLLILLVPIAGCSHNSGIHSESHSLSSIALEELCGYSVAAASSEPFVGCLVTKPAGIINLLALRLLSMPVEELDAMQIEGADQQSRELFLASTKGAIQMPESSEICRWTTYNTNEQCMGSVVEMSPLVANPFATGQKYRSGYFLRVSYGGWDGEWYWIAVEKSGASRDRPHAVLIELPIDE
ncbi:MAG: hypothetical protein MI919_30680 [Holophagales bacterium]|nr:hypothetical protein [Holophagales bacterium]